MTVDPIKLAELERARKAEIRRFPRYEVHLQVRYADAQHYVEEYAYNLSQGGLFMTGCQDLEPMQLVTVEVNLPGYGNHRVETRVAYVLKKPTGGGIQRPPGAGLAIVTSPPGFEQALKRYLAVLGKRRDTLVMVCDPTVRMELATAGFSVAEAPPLERASAVILDTARVLALVVPESERLAYQSALAESDLPTDLIVGVEGKRSPGELLNTLDRRIQTMTGGSLRGVP